MDIMDSIAINLIKCLSVRRWRHKNAIGAVGQWQVEVGEPIGGPDTSCSSLVIKENCSNVSFLLCPHKNLTTTCEPLHFLRTSLLIITFKFFLFKNSMPAKST